MYHYHNTKRYFLLVLSKNKAQLKSSPAPPKHQVLKPSLSAYGGFTSVALSPDILHLESILIQAIQSLCTEVTSSAVIFLCN